jgi:hypothetical protein
MPIAEDSAGGSPVPIPTNLTTNLTGEATGSGTLDYTSGDIDIAVTVVDNGHNHILSNITDVQVNNAISGQILVYNGTVWANATNTSGITAIVQDLTPQLGGNLDLNGKNINGNGNINLADNYKLTLGTGNDLELSHDGVSSYIRDVGAGDLQIFASDDVYIRGQGTNSYMARFNESGAVTLYHNNVVRLITTDSGITVTDEVEAAEFIGKLRGPTKFKGQAGEALSAGDPVYISGISGNTTIVSKADANDASKMPAFGIINASVSANVSCEVLTFGEMHNLDTSAFSEGDELYVSNTGTLTTAIPSGESSQIQKIAKVTRSHASAGGIFIMGAGRSNAVPNLDNGDIFIGDGTNYATTTSLNTAVNALTLTNYLPLSGGAMTGNITTSGTFDGRDVSVDGAKLDGIATGADVTLNEISAGTNVTISAGGVISATGGTSGIAHVVDDTSPELGGNLSLNSHDITGTGNLNFTGSVTLSGTVDGRDVAADGTKLDGIEASADVTDTANVTAAGALMDSEVTNLAQVKAFDSSDYATAAQGTTADAALPKAGGTMTGDILFNDSVKAKFGDSSDLQIFHNGTDSYVYDTGEGDLILRGSSNIKLQSAAGTALSTFTAAGASTLYYSAAEKLATTSSGIDITGNVNATASLTFGSGGAYEAGSIYSDANWGMIHRAYTASPVQADHLFVNSAGTERMRIDTAGMDVTGGIEVANPTNYTGIHLRGNGAPNVTFGRNNVTTAEWKAGISGNLGTSFTISEGTAAASERLTIATGGDVSIPSGNLNATRSGGSTLTLENSITSISANELIGGIDFKGNDTSEDGNEVLAFIRANALDTTPDSCIRFGTLQNNGGVDDVVTERMRLDNYGRLGIGTTSPSVKLQTTVANSSTEAIRITNDTDAVRTHMYPAEIQAHNSNLTLNANDGGFATVIKAAGAERMRIDSGGIDVTGNIDISGAGTRRLNISNTTLADTGEMATFQWDNNANLTIQGRTSAGGFAANWYSIQTTDTDGRADAHIFYTDASTERMRINSTGIDVTGAIDVANGTTYTTTGDFLAKVQQNSNASGKNGLSVMNAWASSTSTIFEAAMGWNGVAAGYYPVFTIDGLGKTTWQDNAGNVRATIDGSGLDVTGDLTVSSTIEVGSLTPAQDGAIEVGVIALGTPAIASTTSSTGLMNHIIFDNPNGAVGKINTLNSSTTYLTSSDYRLKTDVQAMTGSIDRVKALRPVNFEWVVDGTRVDGFLAHEAQEVVPEAVDGEKDAMRDQQYVESEATGDIYTPAVEATYETIQVELTPAVEATYDDEGNELTPAVNATYEEQQQELTPAIDEVIHSSDVVEPDELEEGQLWRETTEKVMATRQVPDYQGIDQSKIVPLLTSALQDAIAKIEALETRLEALES